MQRLLGRTPSSVKARFEGKGQRVLEALFNAEFFHEGGDVDSNCLISKQELRPTVRQLQLCSGVFNSCIVTGEFSFTNAKSPGRDTWKDVANVFGVSSVPIGPT